MPAPPPIVSLEQFERIPDDPSGCRTELVRGRVVGEPPAGFEHGYLGAAICAILHRFVWDHNLGIVVTAETGFVLSDDPPTVRAPDAAFVAADRLPVGTTRIKGFARLAPDLAVEVISPTNTPNEILAKVRDYLEAGTRLVWVMDPDTTTARVYRVDGSVELRHPSDDLNGEDVLPGFRAALADLFRHPTA